MFANKKLPRYPPRKAYNSPHLINFVVKTLTKLEPLAIKLPSSSHYTQKNLWTLLTLASMTRTSISRKTKELRERGQICPAGESILRWIRRADLEEITEIQQLKFHRFLDFLPHPFQRARKKGMVLAMDFHMDPNYAQHPGEYIIKSLPKCSTNQFFGFISVLWLNAPTPITLAVKLVAERGKITQLVQTLLAPWIAQEKVTLVLADGEFYIRDLISWFQEQNTSFVIRAHLRGNLKSLATTYLTQSKDKHKGCIIPHVIKKRHTKMPCPICLVLWQGKGQIRVLALSASASLTVQEAKKAYQRRFCIETYYRMMHRFQAFSCSQHPTIRFVLVSFAFWLCNLWCYFKAPLQWIKPMSKRVETDKTYTADTFCEFVVNSWHIQVFLTTKRSLRGG